MFARASFALVLTLVACGDDDTTPLSDAAADAPTDAFVPVDAPPVMQPTFTDEHVYARVLPPFESVDACRAGSPEGTTCTQSMVFCPTGDFTLRLTEVVNAGGYALRPGNVVQALRRGTGDGPERFSGVVDDDAGTFTSETEGLAGVWTRELGTPACL
ncbi:MAG: hypothetical protein H6721_28425 [Sandaracinus sp.]|nr:hypothetical protein [Sandaracinus sp.]MCB9636056.1 hypothetical protein [Sandaracinus sp.]